MPAIILGIAAAVLISLGPLVRSLATARPTTTTDHDFANRELSALDVSNLLLSTSFSLNGLLYQTWLGYQLGWTAVWLQAIWCAGFLILLPRARRIAAASEHGGMHGELRVAFGQSTQAVAALASILGLMIQVGWETVICLDVFSRGNPMLPAVTIGIGLVIALAVSAYTAIGGIRASASANRLQNGSALLSLVLLVILLWNSGVDASFHVGLAEAATMLGVGGLVTNVVFSLAWQFVDMTTWQSLGARDRGATPARTIWLSALLIFVAPGVLGTAFGIALRPHAGLTDATVLSESVAALADRPLLHGVVVCGLLCAMLSTVDGLLLGAARASVQDLPLARLRGLDDAGRLRYQRGAILLLACAGIVGVLVLQLWAGITPFELVYLVIVPQCSLLPTVLVALFKPAWRRGASASIVVGTLVGLAMSIGGARLGIGDLTTWAGTATIAVAATVLVLPNVLLPAAKGQDK